MKNAALESLSVVIPAYNEEACIEKVISDLYAQVLNHFLAAELIVIDDGSADATREILRRLSSHYPNMKVLFQARAGHGRAILKGYLTARNDWIFQLDSDAQFEAEDFWKLWERHSGAKLILGNRAKRQDSALRLFVSRVLKSLVFLLFGVAAPDINIPFRLFRRDIFQEKVYPRLPRNSLIPNTLISLAFFRLGFIPAAVDVQHKGREVPKNNLPSFKLIYFCLHSAAEVLIFRFSLKFLRRKNEK